MAFNWTCPHCGTTQTVVSDKTDLNTHSISLSDQHEGPLLIQDYSIGCSNPNCLRTTIRIKIANGKYNGNRYVFFTDAISIFDQQVYPLGASKPQPDYIPLPIREDYFEACLIRDFSPKASATLIRRCLQGMIRDFAKIAKARLIDEITALRAAVDAGTADRAISMESVDAIDKVRGIGNIGAHMEKDIDLIVEVDPGEAQALIELVEMLFAEWYGARDRRQARLAHIEMIAAAKKEAKSLPGPNALAALLPPSALATQPASASDILLGLGDATKGGQS